MKILDLIKGLLGVVLTVLFYVAVGVLCLLFLPVILLISLIWG